MALPRFYNLTGTAFQNFNTSIATQASVRIVANSSKVTHIYLLATRYLPCSPLSRSGGAPQHGASYNELAGEANSQAHPVSCHEHPAPDLLNLLITVIRFVPSRSLGAAMISESDIKTKI
jgi:hypothetical protein